MFKNEFQGGPFLEILTIQGKESQSRYQPHGMVRKDFDKDVKSYVLLLEGDTAQSKILIPKNEKQTLHILQRFLVLQLNVPLGAAFSLEVVVLDESGQKRRLLFSTSHKEICVTSFHVKVPLVLKSRGIWGNLCLDIKSFVEETFKSCSYKAIERITITANCKLRKIISMKHRIPESSFQDDAEDLCYSEDEICDVETASRLLQLNVAGDGKQAVNQVCNVKKLLHSDIKLRQSSGSAAKLISRETSETSGMHIAFGTRSLAPRSPQKTSHSSERLQSVSSSSSSAASVGNSTKTEGKSSVAEFTPQIEAQRLPFQPRPPKQSSGLRKRRPNPRLRVCDSPTLTKKDSAKGKITSAEMTVNEVSEVKSPVSLDVHESTKNYNELDANNNSADHMNFYSDAHISSDLQTCLDAKKCNARNDKNSMQCSHEDGKDLRPDTDGLVMGNSADLEDYFRVMREEEEQFVNQASADAKQENLGNSSSQKLSDDHTFLYSSYPKRPLKSQRLGSSSDGSVFGTDSNNNNLRPKLPDVVVTGSGSSLGDTQGSTRSTGFASLESDFVRQSSDSEGDSPLDKVHRLGTKHRRSPLPSPSQSPSLRANRSRRGSGKSSKKTAVTRKYEDENERYQSAQSDSMSWYYDSDTSQRLSASGSVHEGSDMRDESGYHEETFLRMKNDQNKETDEKSDSIGRLSTILGEDIELGADSEDCLTDDSDETSFSVWQSPPSQIRNYRYQDEMHGIGMTLDLAATLPMTPFIEEMERTMPVLTSETKDQVFLNDKSPASLAVKSDGQGDANVLDLMYDPDLNCYYDPKTHNYYELA